MGSCHLDRKVGAKGDTPPLSARISPDLEGALAAPTDDEDAGALTTMLEAAERGELAATPELFAALYRELHRVARRQLHFNNAGGLTLGATTLLHEAYLDLSSRGLAFPDENRFFAYAARAMRGLIVDYVRERRAIKRGGQFHLTTLDTFVAESVAETNDLGPLSEALDELAVAEPALAELVELKFFCGFGFAEIAAMRGVSERTVQRDWNKARLFLRSVLHDEA
jgi:RNA polymerase sigma factor (TIGR02999 family)